MAVLADAGWRVCLVTAFTRSVHPAEGFALACQLDKGLGPEVDYMALRRGEDRVAAGLLGVADLRMLDLPEAPHRGYESAKALFGPMLPGDDIWRTLSPMLKALADELKPGLVLAPQGLGGHVDHRQQILALRDAALHTALAYYRDTPYAMRDEEALPFVTPEKFRLASVWIEAGLDRKVAAACGYGSQVSFQFGSAAEAGTALRAFALSEGCGQAAERFLIDGVGGEQLWSRLPQFCP